MGLFGQSKSEKQLSIVTSALASLATGQMPAVNNAVYGWLMNNQFIFPEDNRNAYVKEGYTSNGDVYACVDILLTKLSRCPLILYEYDGTKEQKWISFDQLRKQDSLDAKYRVATLLKYDIREVQIDGISKLLYQPNQYQTWTEFIKEYAGWYLLQGNSYLYKNGPNPANKKYTEIIPLPANYITIVSGGAMRPVKGYKVIGSATYTDSNAIDFESERVSHIKTFNPDYTAFGNQLYGMPPLRPFLITLAKNKLSKAELARQAKNGGALGVFSPKTNSEMGADVKQDIKEQIAEAKSSDELVKRILVSRAPGEWTQIGLPSVEMQLLESLNVDQKDIANCFHVPVILLNNTEGSTYNNVQEAGKQLIQNAVQPLGDIIADRLTRDLCPAYETGRYKYKLAFDYSVLPEMQQDMKTQVEALSKADFLTKNEKRAYIGYGVSDNPIADELLIDGNTRLLSDLEITDSAFTNA